MSCTDTHTLTRSAWKVLGCSPKGECLLHFTIYSTFQKRFVLRREHSLFQCIIGTPHIAFFPSKLMLRKVPFNFTVIHAPVKGYKPGLFPLVQQFLPFLRPCLPLWPYGCKSFEYWRRSVRNDSRDPNRQLFQMISTFNLYLNRHLSRPVDDLFKHSLNRLLQDLFSKLFLKFLCSVQAFSKQGRFSLRTKLYSSILA